MLELKNCPNGWGRDNESSTVSTPSNSYLPLSVNVNKLDVQWPHAQLHINAIYSIHDVVACVVILMFFRRKVFGFQAPQTCSTSSVDCWTLPLYYELFDAYTSTSVYIHVSWSHKNLSMCKCLLDILLYLSVGALCFSQELDYLFTINCSHKEIF